MKKDRAFEIAFANGAIAAGIFAGKNQAANMWPTLGGTAKSGDPMQIAADELATFVRRNRDAPPEALYRHAFGRGIHTTEPGDWEDVPIAYRMAYGLFATSLLYLDRELEAEVQRLELREEQARDPLRRHIPPDQRTLEHVAGLNDKFDELVEAAATRREKEQAEREAANTPVREPEPELAEEGGRGGKRSR